MRPEVRCQIGVSPALPLFLFRQYDEAHELFRDDLPFRAGPHHLRAQEVAGDRAPGREVHERVQAGFERVQGTNRAGDFESRRRKRKSRSKQFCRPAPPPQGATSRTPYAASLEAHTAEGGATRLLGGSSRHEFDATQAASDDEPLFATNAAAPSLLLHRPPRARQSLPRLM